MPKPDPCVIWLRLEKDDPASVWELVVPLHNRRYPVTPEVSAELDTLFLILEYEAPQFHE